MKYSRKWVTVIPKQWDKEMIESIESRSECNVGKLKSNRIAAVWLKSIINDEFEMTSIH